MKRSLILLVGFFGVFGVIIALNRLCNSYSDRNKETLCEVRFQISKDGYLRGLTTTLNSSIPLVVGEHTTSKPTGSLTTMYGEGSLADIPVGYVFESLNDGNAKVWLSSARGDREWMLNAESGHSKNIKVFLEVQQKDGMTKHRDWVLRMGTNRQVLATGNRGSQ